jgi:hypothetical protein
MATALMAAAVLAGTIILVRSRPAPGPAPGAAPPAMIAAAGASYRAPLEPGFGLLLCWREGPRQPGISAAADSRQRPPQGTKRTAGTRPAARDAPVLSRMAVSCRNAAH